MCTNILRVRSTHGPTPMPSNKGARGSGSLVMVPDKVSSCMLAYINTCSGGREKEKQKEQPYVKNRKTGLRCTPQAAEGAATVERQAAAAINIPVTTATATSPPRAPGKKPRPIRSIGIPDLAVIPAQATSPRGHLDTHSSLPYCSRATNLLCNDEMPQGTPKPKPPTAVVLHPRPPLPTSSVEASLTRRPGSLWS